MAQFSEFDHLHEHLEKMWDRLVGGPPGQPRFLPPVLEPPTDVYQTDDTVVVVIEVGGMRGQDVDLSIDDGRITVRGDKPAPPPGDRRYSQMEIGRGPFERVIPLPAPVDGERLSVRYEDGLLEITLPKRQPAGLQRVRVRVREP